MVGGAHVEVCGVVLIDGSCGVCALLEQCLLTLVCVQPDIKTLGICAIDISPRFIPTHTPRSSIRRRIACDVCSASARACGAARCE